MEKGELIEEVAKETGTSAEETLKIVDSFIDTIKDGLLRGEKVSITGFGTFSVSKRKAREFLNPKTNQIHKLPEKAVPNFKPGSVLQRFLRK